VILNIVSKQNDVLLLKAGNLKVELDNKRV